MNELTEFINLSKGLKHLACGPYTAHQPILCGSLTNHLPPNIRYTRHEA
jgi:hypothetical protein